MTRPLALIALCAAALLVPGCDDVQGTTTSVIATMKIKIKATPAKGSARRFGGKGIASGNAVSGQQQAFNSMSLEGFDANSIFLNYDDGVAAAHTVAFFSAESDPNVNDWVRVQILESSAAGRFSAVTVDTSTITGTATCSAKDQESLKIRAKVTFSGTVTLTDTDTAIPMSGTIAIVGAGDATGEFNTSD